jgi:Pvc16 N-terminal domain
MHTALRATSLTLAKFLEDRLKSGPGLSAFFSGGNMVVSLNTPQEMKDNNLEGLSVWLYRVIRDEERLNDPPRWLSPTQLQPPPLPVRLHYLITPITEKRRGRVQRLSR